MSTIFETKINTTVDKSQFVRPGFLGAVVAHFIHSFSPLKDALETAGVRILDKSEIRRMKKRKMEDALDSIVNRVHAPLRHFAADGTVRTIPAKLRINKLGPYEREAMQSLRGIINAQISRAGWFNHQPVLRVQGMRHRFYQHLPFRAAYTAIWWCRTHPTLHDLLWDVPDAAAHIPLDLASTISNPLPEGTVVEYEWLEVNSTLYDPIVYVKLGRERYAIAQWD